MKITVHNTSKIVDLEHDGGIMPARVWEGHTDSGVPVIVFITRIAAARDQDLTEFNRDLQEVSPPSVAVASWPTRMIL